MSRVRREPGDESETVVAEKPKRCPMCADIASRYRRDDKWVAAQHCERCGEHSMNTAPFHPNDGAAIEDAGVRLCPSCWIPALKRRYELDPISAEDRKAMVAELIAKLAGKFALPEPVKIVAPESTQPTCAGCGVPDASAILRDGRLWHAACWDRRRGMRGAR